jgi:hypothetical protein
MRDGATPATAPPGPVGEDVHGSFGEFLGDLQILFPPALVAGAGWQRLLALARRLPIHVADNRFGFEFHLLDPDPAADFCVVPLPGTRLAEFYIRQGERAAAGSEEAALGAFLATSHADAAPPHGLPARSECGVILEYDLAGISLGWSSQGPRNGTNWTGPDGVT